MVGNAIERLKKISSHPQNSQKNETLKMSNQLFFRNDTCIYIQEAVSLT